tara:strand:+ start:3274 stop:3651 length:378 start_codon:yes stop_codon:yes gene_type:complete
MDNSNMTDKLKEDISRMLDDKDITQPKYDSSMARRPAPSVMTKINIALLEPSTHAGQPYSERKVIFTDNAAYVRVKIAEGWNSMLKLHYDERIAIDKGPVHRDNSWVRKIVEPIYAKIRKQRRKY